MTVLVGGQLHHDVGSGRIVQLRPGVAVRDARGQFLDGHVAHAVGGRLRLGNDGAADLGHASVLEHLGVHQTTHGDVIAHDDGVPALLGGPALGPRPPRRVSAEHARDGARVPRQIVLGEQVHQQRGTSTRRQRSFAVRESGVLQPGGALPRHVLVGIPLFRGFEMAIEKTLGLRFEFTEDVHVVHRPNLAPTVRMWGPPLVSEVRFLSWKS